MSDPQITTVIPTYRRPTLLRRAIESVLRQSYRNLLVQVCDNNSGDETESVVREYLRSDARVAYIRRPENIGPCANMAEGVTGVRTPYYSLLNDDDFLLPGFYEEAVAQLARHPRAMFACAPAISVDLILGRMQRRNRDWPPGFYEPSDETCRRMFLSHFSQPGVVLRREMSELIGPFEMSGDDRLYMTIAAGSRAFVTLERPGAVFLVHASSYSSTVGLRGSASAEVYDQFLSTLRTILNLDVEAPRKVHLILWTFRAYGSTFESRAIAELVSRGGASEEFASLPLRTSGSAVARDLIRRTPVSLRMPVGYVVSRLQKALLKVNSASSSWDPLPEELRASIATGELPKEVSLLLTGRSGEP